MPATCIDAPITLSRASLTFREEKPPIRNHLEESAMSSRNRDIERSIQDASDRVGDRVRQYANGAAGTAHDLIERGRRAGSRFGKRGDSYRKQLTHAAEDLADEANYQYRRLRRQVNRHPAATVAIVAGTVGAFLLLRRVFRSHDED
jgi:hypothetical protein